MDTSVIRFILMCLFTYFSATTMAISSQNEHRHEDVQHRKHKFSSNIQHKNHPIAFGGVLNQWIYGVGMNDTNARMAVKFAVKYARRKMPDIFPSKSDVKCLHYARNINKMKIIYTSDNKHPALFSMLDPAQLQPITMPIIWGFMYHFNIDVFPPDKTFKITHYFTLLEYTDEQFYVLEHSFNCPEISRDIRNRIFGSTCVIPQIMTYITNTTDSSVNNTTKTSDQSGTMIFSNDQSTMPEHHTEPQVNESKTSNDVMPADFESSKLPSHQSELISAQLDLLSRDVLSSIPFHRKSHFSILSYNIWNTNVRGNSGNAHFRYAQRIQHLAKLCQDLHPDVIAFQEVRFEDSKGGSLGPNQLQHLSLLLSDYRFVFQPGQVQTSSLPGLVIEGVAVFSRHPITSREHVLLSRNPSDAADGHQRVLLHAEVDIPFVGKINVLNTHLSLSHEARLRSVQEIGSYMQTLPGPVFLAGDFNAEAHNEEVRYLGGKYPINGQKMTGFHDIWELHHGNHNKGFTFSTLDSELSKRIDFIFMKEQDGLVITKVEQIDDNTRGPAAASDHLGLLGRFAMQT